MQRQKGPRKVDTDIYFRDERNKNFFLAGEGRIFL
jgi:hypothetical protein